MKFSNLKKAALLSLFAVGTVIPQAYAADPTNSDIDMRRAKGESSKSIFDWLQAQSFSDYVPLFSTYKYFFDRLPGWVTTYFPNPQTFPGNPKAAGTLYAAPGNATFNFNKNYVIVNAAQNDGGTWDAVISGDKNPTLPPVPIDGGASLLLAAGAAYGLKRLRTKKGENPETEM